MYSIGRAFKNICKNLRLSLASVATISACIFLFCLFFSVIINLRSAVTSLESKVGITVFFNEDLSENEIVSLGDMIKARPEVKEVEYTSAEQAWENFKADYFKGKKEETNMYLNDHYRVNNEGEIETEEELMRAVENGDLEELSSGTYYDRSTGIEYWSDGTIKEKPDD